MGLGKYQTCICQITLTSICKGARDRAAFTVFLYNTGNLWKLYCATQTMGENKFVCCSGKIMVLVLVQIYY